ncbi:hypothetical protein GGR50DRAFT_650187 [Xylaria sp. CBS 124048]|nr:hypothetical protein GGR50DRAFT_650187 [Xylaria sp. CBS 124048]
MAEEDIADVFAFPDFSLSTKWLTLPGGSQFFNLDLGDANSRDDHNDNVARSKPPPSTSVHEFFKIPDTLVASDPENPDDKDGDTNAIAETLHDVALPDLDIIDELWYTDSNPPTPSAEYKTWEAFTSPSIPTSAPLFITEAGPSMYDAAIMNEYDPLRLKSRDHLVIRSKPYLAALVALTLGRGSVFFVWDEPKLVFVSAVAKMRISGYSTNVLQGLQDSCLQSGIITRLLSSYVQLTYKTRPSPVKVALAKAVDLLLLAIQQQFGERGKQVKSILQLRALVEPVDTMLVHIYRLVQDAAQMKTDEDALSQVFRETEILETDHSFIRPLMCEILSRVTEPWVDFVKKWIGVKGEEGFPLTKDGPGKSFVKVQNVAKVDDTGFEFEEREYVLDESRMPHFIPPDIGMVMFEAGRNLRLLRTHHPDHPLCQIDTIVSSKPPGFKWLLDWRSIETLKSEVERYERAVLQKISSKSIGHISQLEADVVPLAQGMLQVFGNDGTQLESQLLASIQALDQPPPIAVAQDSLFSLLEKCLFPKDVQPQTIASDCDLHWSLVPSHSFGPLVTAQAKLINREYMKLLFSVHDLRENLRIQKEFHLLGNGMFCSRLSHALFDPDLETAERKAGVALNGGIMGLRLNGRETWPPASSELRLALMGILGETYLPPSTQEAQHASNTETPDLPGDLSFALRDLPPEEIDKCMDPTSLEALDFLRLAYKTPAPLSPIITPVILVKYDKLFKSLLRVLRMLYVVSQLFRDTSKMERKSREVDNVWLRFRFEAQHFVQSMASFFFDTGIETPWLQFQIWLDGVESSLARPGKDIVGARVVSPDEVREEHEKMLDRIMNTLLLRKRQQPVMALLEEIFKLILQFSRQVQLEVSGKVEGDASRVIIGDLFRVFRKKVEVFVTVCHGLNEKGGATGRERRQVDGGRRSEGNAENTIDRLLAKLDMLGYYSRPKF